MHFACQVQALLFSKLTAREVVLGAYNSRRTRIGGKTRGLVKTAAFPLTCCRRLRHHLPTRMLHHLLDWAEAVHLC